MSAGAVALVKEKEIVEQNAQIIKEKVEAEEALAQALPALEEAKNGLQKVKKSDITEIKSFAKPPIHVKTILECMLVIKGIKDVSWKAAKSMIGDPKFLRSLAELDVDAISDEQVNTVKALMKEMNITVEEMKKASAATVGLMIFVNAVMEYCSIAREIKPKLEKVARLEREIHLNEKELERIKKDVAEN